MNKLKDLLARFTGRTTLFCSFFFVAGNVFHWLHRLDGTYIGFMGTLMGFVAGHAVQENFFQSKSTDSGQNGQKVDGK